MEMEQFCCKIVFENEQGKKEYLKYDYLSP